MTCCGPPTREGGADAVRSAAAEMEMTLQAAGVAEVGAPTAALLEELAPGGIDAAARVRMTTGNCDDRGIVTAGNRDGPAFVTAGES